MLILSKVCRVEDADCRVIFLHRKPDGFVESRVLKNSEYTMLRAIGIDLRVLPELL